MKNKSQHFAQRQVFPCPLGNDKFCTWQIASTTLSILAANSILGDIVVSIERFENFKLSNKISYASKVCDFWRSHTDTTTVCDQHVWEHNKEIKPPLKQNLEIHLTRMFNLKEFLKAKAYRPIGNCQTEDIHTQMESPYLLDRVPDYTSL